MKHSVRAYRNNDEHLSDELRLLELLLRRRVDEFRCENEAICSKVPAHGLYVTHEEVDHILAGGSREGKGVGASRCVSLDGDIESLRREIDAMAMLSKEEGVFLALPELANFFGLSPFEMQVVVLCLAAELRPAYHKLFAYLQDDIARKKPTLWLVGDLLCETEADRWRMKGIFVPDAPLKRFGIVRVSDDEGRFLTLDGRIVDFLMGNNGIGDRLVDTVTLYGSLPSWEDVSVEPAVKNRLKNVLKNRGMRDMVLHLHGPSGVGKRGLAGAVCRELTCRLLHLDLELLQAKGDRAGMLLQEAFRESRLMRAVLYIDNIDVPLSGDSRLRALVKVLERSVAIYGGLTILASESPESGLTIEPESGLTIEPESGLTIDSESRQTEKPLLFYSLPIPVPGARLRSQVWAAALKQENIGGDFINEWSVDLSGRFRLTPGQIRRAVQLAACRDGSPDDVEHITLEHLYTAARRQSNLKLTQLAKKIEPKYRWCDVVLEEEKIEHLKEICRQMTYRRRVFDRWGFGEKISRGRGLSILFTGPPGTGKTMTAEVMAGELQLDLYKIDLSGVVSKYIGETEKNLERIFTEAENSNAVLFFDEADALFGKRTEVGDAHDRYANIETGYLLQKMEEYGGVVILATNFRKNMDDAFIRRIRFIVEFPFPGKESRSRIWKTHFPRQAPLGTDIDYELLAGQLPLSGGNIRNIVLNAAFNAAGNGGVIGMNHILNGARREYEKIGKLWPPGGLAHRWEQVKGERGTGRENNNGR